MDAGWASIVPSHWVRERGLYTLAEGVRRLTAATAPAVLGRQGRGVPTVGPRADVNGFDAALIGRHQPEIVQDFPGGATRFIQRAVGYPATVCLWWHSGQRYLLSAGKCWLASSKQTDRPWMGWIAGYPDAKLAVEAAFGRHSVGLRRLAPHCSSTDHRPPPTAAPIRPHAQTAAGGGLYLLHRIQSAR